jgi:hypothetical protein
LSNPALGKGLSVHLLNIFFKQKKYLIFINKPKNLFIMIKKFFSFAILAGIFMFMFSCGGPKVEVSKDMSDFLAMVKGTSSDVTNALAKYATDEQKNNDMSMYDLKEPKVTAKEGDCYTVEFKAGMTTRTYKLCWADGKINKIDDLGMK